MDILDRMNGNEALKELSVAETDELCKEIRKFLIENISKTGGHLASNLGAVELSVALHRVYTPERDRILFDVGHQAYTHKILTGRREAFHTLRQIDGVSGFPKPHESEADAYVVGHASTSVSLAYGMAKARTMLDEAYDVVAVIGDGALTGGLAYEGLCNAGQSGEPLVVVLNDNAMSIDGNVGGVESFLSRMRLKPGYIGFKRLYRATVGKVKPLYNFLHGVKEFIKGALLPKNIFDDMGFCYLGPVDGHDVVHLESVLTWAREMRVPVLLHVLTKKGKGCEWAEREPNKYHGVGPFDPDTGKTAVSGRDFSEVMGETLTRLANDDDKLVAISAAMTDGTGLSEFAKCHANRMFDVGIAEGHAVTAACAMAKQGLRPVVALYSSFLQRAYDMLIHDAGLTGEHVVFCVDRAGLVGNDGETHQGVYDVAFLKTVPGMSVLCPASFAELRDLLREAVYEYTGPVAVRYPRGGEGEYTDSDLSASRVLREGKDLTIVSYGMMINEAMSAAALLESEGIETEVVKLTRIWPLESADVCASVKKTGRLMVLEEVCAAGSVGENLLAELSGTFEFRSRLLNLGDGVVEHGKVHELKKRCGLDDKTVTDTARELVKNVR